MTLIKPEADFANPRGQIVRFSFARARPSLRATVAVSGAFRAAALSALHTMTGSDNSFLLAGRYADGRPDREHRHAYYLPQPGSAESLFGMLVVSPYDRFSEEEMSALRAIRVLQWNGPTTRISVELVDAEDEAARTLASHWISGTPYVPSRRFWGTHGKHHLAPGSQLRSELKHVAGDVSLSDIKTCTWGEVPVRVSSVGSNRELSPPQRRGFRVEFRTVRPICGPLALGHSSHFGLGLFVPAHGVNREAPTVGMSRESAPYSPD